MPISKRAKGHNGGTHDTLENTAREKNLGKRSDALKNRFAKLISSQINVMKNADPNLNSVDFQVNIKHREVRKVLSPEKYSQEMNNHAQYELQSEQRAGQSKDVTAIHMRKTYKKQQIIRTDAESPDRLRKNIHERIGNSSFVKSPVEFFEQEDNKTVRYKNKSPIVSRNMSRDYASVESSARNPDVKRNYDRSPVLTRNNVGSSSPERNSARRFTSPESRTGRRIVKSPISARNYVRSPISSRNTAGSPVSMRSSAGSSTLNRTSWESPTSLRSTPSSVLLSSNSSRSPPPTRYVVGIHTLERYDAESPMSERYNAQYPRPLLTRSGATSPLITRSGASSHFNTRSGASSPLDTWRGASSPLITRSGAPSPIDTWRGASSPLITRSGAPSPIDTWRGAPSPLITRSGASSPLSTRSGTSSLSYNKSAFRSPTLTRKYAGSPILAKYAGSPCVARNNAGSLDRSVIGSPLSTRDLIRSPLSNRKGTESPTLVSNVAESLLVARKDDRSTANGGSRSPIIRSTAVCNRSQTVERNISPVLDRSTTNGGSRSPIMRSTEVCTRSQTVERNISPVLDRSTTNGGSRSPIMRSTEVCTRSQTVEKNISPVLAGSQRSTLVTHAMPSPIGKRLQTIVNRLGGYNRSVSPKMEKIKESLSPRKVATESRLVSVTKHCMKDRFATTESAKSYTRSEQTSITKAIPLHQHDDTITRTSAEISEHGVLTAAPRSVTYTLTSVQSENDSFPKQTFNNHVGKSMTISKKETYTNITPIAGGGEQKLMQMKTLSTDSRGTSNGQGRFDHRIEVKQLVSPVSDDQSTKCLDVRRKLQFNSPTELQTCSSISHKLVKGRNVPFASVSENDTQTCDEVSRSTEDRNLTLTTYSNRSFISDKLSRENGERSTFLLESFDSLDQRPLAHSTPIPEQSTVRYSPVSPTLKHSDSSFASKIDDDKRNYCGSCSEHIKSSPREQKDDKCTFQMINKGDMKNEYTESERKYQNDLTRSRDTSSQSGRSEESGVRIFKGKYFNENERRPKVETDRSAVIKFVQNDLRDDNGLQKQRVCRETRTVKQSGKGIATSISKEQQMVNQVEYNGHKIGLRTEKSCYTNITKDGNRVQKHIRHETNCVNLTDETPTQTNVVKEQRTMKQLGHSILQAAPDNKKATQSNTTQERNIMLKQLAFNKYQEGRNNEKVCQVNMTLEEKETIRQIEPGCSFVQQKTELNKVQNVKGKVEKTCQRKSLEIQTKSDTGIQTDIFEKYKRLMRHEQSSQTDIYTHSETSEHINTAGTPYNIKHETIHKDSIRYRLNAETRDEKKTDIEALQRAYEDIQKRLHVSATTTLVSVAEDALKKAIDDDFHRELWIALNDNVHLLYEDFKRFASTCTLPKDADSSNATVSELEYKIKNRIETLLTLCNDLDKNEFREHIEQLIGRLRSACFEQGAQSCAGQFVDEMKTLLSGLTNLTENFAVCGERLLGKTNDTQCHDRMPYSDSSQEFPELHSRPSGFLATADISVKRLLQLYSGRTRPNLTRTNVQSFRSRRPRTLSSRFRAFLHRHMFAFILIMLGIAFIFCGTHVARSIYILVRFGLMYVDCNVRLVHTSQAVV